MDDKSLNRYIREYLTAIKVKTKKTGQMLHLDCPSCGAPEAANVPPNCDFINCLSCNAKITIIDAVKMYEGKFDLTDEEILLDIKTLLNLQDVTPLEEKEILKLFEFYQKEGFDLVPVVAGGKIPCEKDWPNKHHKNEIEWIEWMQSSLNCGIKTGSISGVTVLDVDQKPIPEEITKIMGDTLIQESTNGFHLFYKYEEEFPKTRIQDFKIDLQNNGGQVVISPSKINGIERRWIELKSPIKMPEELKVWLRGQVTAPKKTYSEEIEEEIQTENFKITAEELKLINNGLEGCCNSAFVKIGGILRKGLNEQQTEFALNVLNDHLLEHPMDKRAISAMTQSLSKYIKFDEEDLGNRVLDYLKKTDTAFKQEIEIFLFGDRAKGENKQRVDKTLNYLLKENKIVKNNREYKLVRDMKWETDLLSVTTPITFKMPYIDDYVWLKQTSLVLLGSRNKYGKTTVAMNFVKRLVDQGIKPYYIYTESDSGFDETALKLGLKEGDFEHCFCSDYDDIILKQNSVVIYDWLKPKDFARTDSVYGDMVAKIKKANAFMLCIAQLRDSNEFFAPDQVGQFPSILMRYLHEDESDGTRTKFKLDLVRRPKHNLRQFEIPCIYDWTTKLVKTVEEIEKEKKK